MTGVQTCALPILGVVERDNIIDGSSITVGNKLIGIASSGLHSNGYSLARRILFDIMKLSTNDPMPGTDTTVGETLLTPTRIYVRSVLNLLKDFSINGIAHITGGGLIDNVPRILPNSCIARFNKNSWEIPEIFSLLQEAGNVEPFEMYRTFNMGIGMVLAVESGDVEDIISRLNGLGERAWLVGEVIKGSPSSEQVELF